MIRTPIRVLLIDDDIDDHVLTEALLAEARHFGAEVDHAYLAEEAIEKMLRGEFDVVLLDYQLGEIDGIELFETARSRGFETPTILLTGQDDEELAEKAMAVGFADYLEKARLDGTILSRTIRYSIERARTANDIRTLNQTLEQRVENRTRELVAANREMEAFCYAVSHDLRAPLRAINSTSSILLEDFGDQLPVTAQEELRRQGRASMRLGNLIDDLLRFVRLRQAGLERRRVSISDLAEDIARELVVPVTVQPDMVVNADATLVRLALTNLIENAAKFSPPNQIDITVGHVDGSYFVRDRGIGFDMAFAHKIFLPFERLHLDDEYPGTGIGLANVKRIVDRHDGDIWAQSVPGEGTTIYFTLGSI